MVTEPSSRPHTSRSRAAAHRITRARQPILVRPPRASRRRTRPAARASVVRRASTSSPSALASPRSAKRASGAELADVRPSATRRTAPRRRPRTGPLSTSTPSGTRREIADAGAMAQAPAHAARAAAVGCGRARTGPRAPTDEQERLAVQARAAQAEQQPASARRAMPSTSTPRSSLVETLVVVRGQERVGSEQRLQRVRDLSAGDRRPARTAPGRHDAATAGGPASCGRARASRWRRTSPPSQHSPSRSASSPARSSATRTSSDTQRALRAVEAERTARSEPSSVTIRPRPSGPQAMPLRSLPFLNSPSICHGSPSSGRRLRPATSGRTSLFRRIRHAVALQTPGQPVVPPPDRRRCVFHTDRLAREPSTAPSCRREA